MKPPRLLLIDDDKEYCEVLRDALGNVYILDIAHSKNGVLGKIQNNNYRAILLDLLIDPPHDTNQPDGFELFQQIRKNNKRVPIITISSLDRGNVMREALLDFGADDFILKHEDDFEKIHKKIQRVIRKEVSIFISYSTKDRNFVKLFVEKLKAKGITFWIDENEILPGNDLYKTIAGGIAKSSHYLIVLSANSIESDWVEKEIRYALEEKKVVIPILYGKMALPEDIKLMISGLKAIPIVDLFEYEVDQLTKSLDDV